MGSLSLLDKSSIHKFTITPIDFVLDFPQADLDIYVFMDLSLGMAAYGNIG